MSNAAAADRVRSASEPMAFTRDEFWRGAWSAWAIFVALMLSSVLISVAITSPALLLSPMWILILLGATALYGGGIGLAALIAGSPIAWAMGRMLRREPRLRIHAATYVGLGILMGALAFAVLRLLWGPSGLGDSSVSLIVLSAIAAPPLGWWRSVRTAHREDLGLRRRQRRRPDEDAAFEDSL